MNFTRKIADVKFQNSPKQKFSQTSRRRPPLMSQSSGPTSKTRFKQTHGHLLYGTIKKNDNQKIILIGNQLIISFCKQWERVAWWPPKYSISTQCRQLGRSNSWNLLSWTSTASLRDGNQPGLEFVYHFLFGESASLHRVWPCMHLTANTAMCILFSYFTKSALLNNLF